MANVHRLFLQGTAGITAILVLAIVATGFVNLRTIRNYLRLSELDSDDRNFRLDAARHFADEKFLPAMPRLLELVHSEPKERAEGASRRSEPKERAEARYSFTGASSQIALTPLAYELYRFGESHEKFDDYRFRVEDGVTAPRDGDGVRVALILAYIEEAWEDRARSITRVKYDHWKKR